MQSDNQKLIQTWLDLQCAMIQGTVRGAVFVGDGATQTLDPLAAWPPASAISAPMVAAARDALAARHQVMQAMQAAAGSDIVGTGTDIIATPLFAGEQPIGVAALEMTSRQQQRREAALQIMSWGSSWLQTIVEHLNTGPNLRLGIVIETIAEAVKPEDAQAASGAVASALGRLLDCTRVAIGFADGNNIDIAAISNTARFEQRTNLLRAIIESMREAMDQDCRISVAGDESSQDTLTVHRAATQLKSEFGAKEVHSIPFAENGKIAGAICIERSESAPLRESDLNLAETIVGIVGPILNTKRAAQLPLHRRTTTSLKRELRRFTEPGHLSFKVGISALAAAFLLTLIVKVDYKVKADAALLGEVQRAVSAPFEGYVAEAPLRAGDVVAAGSVMARIDDRDLSLEQARWGSEVAQLGKERREALALHDRAKLSIVTAKYEQAKAKLALAEEKLARTEIKAPINGIVVSGDLSQSLGAPVKRGDLLFEIAPLNRYRIVLEVDERDIGHLQPGQHGALTLTSQPHQHYPFSVTRIVPTSTARDGHNFFAVEAKLDKPSNALRPGMAGIGKISAGERPLLWIWTHRLGERIRLKFWEWFG